MEIKYSNTGRSAIMKDYLSLSEKLNSFYSFSPTKEGLNKALQNRHFDKNTRKVLHSVLLQQYQNIDVSEKTKTNIELLAQENSFTITTGHQLSLCSGPLFFIYKILSAIALSEQLKKQHPDKNFVPVYWMASEDHDFEEINHFYLFGKKHEWLTDQKGAVGRFQLNDLNQILEQIPDFPTELLRCYAESKNLSEATLKLVNYLFGNYGLVVVEPDNKVLKSLFKPILKKELSDELSKKTIDVQSQKLTDLGFKAQILPREINLFYIDNGLRERIVLENGSYKVLNTDLNFSHQELLEKIEQEPEKFSPNVALRPMYQETVLPNLAYIGGPGELAYWLQLKTNFDRLEVFFPALIHRDSFLILTKSNQKSLDKFGLQLSDLQRSYDDLKKDFMAKATENEVTLNSEATQIEAVLNALKPKITDKTLHPAVDAEIQKIKNALENLEKRIRKSEERQHETELNQIKKLLDATYPDKEPQERHLNFLNFYINDPNFIDNILSFANPLDHRQKVIYL